MPFNLLIAREFINRHLPRATSKRKVAEILSIVLVVEGLSVLLLFSYVGVHLGFVSIVAGSILLFLLREEDSAESAEADTPGIRLVDFLLSRIGGEFAMMLVGASIVAAVLVYNSLFSTNPALGDSDSLTILLGLIIILYPIASVRFRVEACFALIFISLIVAMLVVPRVLVSHSDASGSQVGDWYVHYMLAAPFASILDLIGIPAISFGNLVTLTFRDGSIHTLGISAYCAGLYSFSIFLAAFAAFVLVFESLPRRITALVLIAGLVVAYLGNLLRMIVIGVVGYFYGIEALHWTHENAGWIIFLGWSLAFWWLILGYTSRYYLDRSKGITEDN